MARPRQYSDEQILEAARDCFLEHGAAVSTTVIARRIGLSQAALFKRFGTKEELMMAALRPGPEMVRELVHWLELGPDERPIPDQLLDLGQQVRRFFGRLLPRVALLRSAGHGPPECSKGRPLPPQVVHAALAAWLAQAADQGRIQAGNERAAAYALLGALNLQAFLNYNSGAEHADPDGLELRALIQVLWRGLAPEGEPA